MRSQGRFGRLLQSVSGIWSGSIALKINNLRWLILWVQLKESQRSHYEVR